jgi:uncharacterized protein (DUF2267 family)
MATAISTFTQAANEAQHWVNELANELGWSERQAYRLLRAVLHALRDWLSPEELADLSSQMPILVRGIFFEGWRPADTPAWDRKKQDFIDRVAFEMRDDMPSYPDDAITAVFGLLTRHLDIGEIDQVRKSMKKPLRDLWPAV